MVEAAEKIQGRRWAEMMEKMERAGDWGRNGLLAVAILQNTSTNLFFPLPGSSSSRLTTLC